jgi:hypothetical protein
MMQRKVTMAEVKPMGMLRGRALQLCAEVLLEA